MFKKPMTVNHTVTIDKEAVDHLTENLKDILKTVGISLVIGIPAVILLGIGANAATDIYVANRIN